MTDQTPNAARPAANDEPPKAAVPPQKMMRLDNFQLEDLERAVFARDFEQAAQHLLVGLRRLRAGGGFIGYPQHDEALLPVLYTRMAAAICTLLADPKMGISHEGGASLFGEHSTIDMLFRASAFRTSDHLLPQFATVPKGGEQAEVERGKPFMTGLNLVKFMITVSLRSAWAPKFAEVFARNPQKVFPLWVGIMAHTLNIHQGAFELREQVHGMHALFEDVDLPPEIIGTLSDAYMYASYSVRPDKHDAKGTIHRIYGRFVRRVCGPLLPEFEGDRMLPSRPTVLVPVEWFTSLHAMYRCYASLLRQLRRDFRVVGIGRDFAFDDVSRQEFDRVHEVRIDTPLEEHVRLITREIRPDVIWYPSLGMEALWTMLASVRLAPVQVMSLGHPSSSRSPCIDYVICDEGAIGKPEAYSEQIITYPNGSARFVMRPDTKLPEVNRLDWPDVVEIAVPAMMCKLNAPFMAALKRIDDTIRASYAANDSPPLSVRFHFFPNAMGLTLQQTAREIREWLPTALIYERSDYNLYLERLGACHLHLCTFPFGGTNSNIDSMMLGLPLVSLWGDEPHERFDGMMQRRAGLPEWTIAKTVDEYVSAAVQLILDHDLRNEVSEHLRKLDIDAVFYGEAPHADRWGFADAMLKAYHRGPRQP